MGRFSNSGDDELIARLAKDLTASMPFEMQKPETRLSPADLRNSAEELVQEAAERLHIARYMDENEVRFLTPKEILASRSHLRAVTVLHPVDTPTPAA